MFSKRYWLLVPTILLAISMQAQSLGDVARQQQKKKGQQEAAASTKPAKKVLTNEDMPQSPSEEGGASPAANRFSPASSSGEPSPPETGASAEQWRARIGAQKDRIAALQKYIDEMQESIHYVEANRYSNGPEYNQAQQRKQQEVDRQKKRLQEEKARLSELQEQARQAGLGSSVYQ